MSGSFEPHPAEPRGDPMMFAPEPGAPPLSSGCVRTASGGWFSPQLSSTAMSSAMRSFLVLCAVLSASAFHAAPAHRQVPLSSRRSVRAAPAMSAPLALATQLAATPISGALPLPSVLVAEGVFDLIEGFAGSPLVLLVPIGAGTLVAFGIIFVLVKSAEPDKQS
jgi:hypothetical protein